MTSKTQIVFSALIAVLLAQGTTLAKSDWIDGDQDEVRIPDPRLQQQRQQDGSQWQQTNPDSGVSSRSGRGYQAADADQTPDPSVSTWDKPSFKEDVLDASGHPFNRDDASNQKVSTPHLELKEGGRNVITGGVNSDNYRSEGTYDRGTDTRAANFINTAPSLGIPHDITVQPGMFKAFIDNQHAGEISAFGKTTLIEVKGRWDDAGHILHSFGMPCTKLAPSAMAKADLSKTKIIVVNCGADFDPPSLEAIRNFVDRGGFLMTTDWALDSCLQKAFPSYVAWTGDYTDNSTVDAVVVDRDPDLTKGIPKVGYWKLEDKSQAVKVVSRKAVQVLVRSRTLMARESTGFGILALTFPYGNGQVLHLVGHLDNNTDKASNSALHDPAPVIGIALRQALAANFIMAAARDGGMIAQDEQKPDSN